MEDYSPDQDYNRVEGNLPGTRGIHRTLYENVAWYRGWHHSPFRVPVHIATIALMIIGSIVTINTLSKSTDTQAAVGINEQLPFQGRLTNSDGTVVADGTYDVTFTLYPLAVGGGAIWTESHTGGSAITVKDGIFTTYLGSITSLVGIDFNDDSRYLGINVAGDGEMSPRIRLGAAPYALNAGQLNGIDGDDYFVLPGQAGGQTGYGGTAASENLVLRSTVHATKGDVLIADDGGDVEIGSTDNTLTVLGDSIFTDTTAQGARLGVGTLTPGSTTMSGSLDWGPAAAGLHIDNDTSGVIQVTLESLENRLDFISTGATLNNKAARIQHTDGTEVLAFLALNDNGTTKYTWTTMDNATGHVAINPSGFGTAAKQLEVRDSTDAQLRLTHTAAVDFADFTVDSSGDLTITPSGGNTIIDGGTVTTSSTPLLVQQTWNNAGSGFQGARFAFTDTASVSASAFDIQVDGSDIFDIKSTGQTVFTVPYLGPTCCRVGTTFNLSATTPGANSSKGVIINSDFHPSATGNIGLQVNTTGGNPAVILDLTADSTNRFKITEQGRISSTIVGGNSVHGIDITHNNGGGVSSSGLRISSINPSGSSAVAKLLLSGSDVATFGYTASGYSGIGTSSPEKPWEVVSSSTDQLRLTHTEAVDFADFQVDTSGNLDVVPSGSYSKFGNTGDSFIVGGGALATTATDGFLYLPGSAGAPTGVPTNFAGRYPITWDATGNTLYIYDVGWNAITGGGGTVTGSGVAGQAAFWTGATSLGGDTGILFDSATDRIRLGTAPANSGSIGIDNNDAIFARNVANSGDISVIKLNASDEVELGADLFVGGDLIFDSGTAFDADLVHSITADRTYTLPDETGTFCTTGSVCTGYAPATGSTVYATRQLDNLTGVAINTSLLPGSDDAIDLGSASFRWRDLYLGPTSLHVQSKAAETTVARDWTLNIQETAGVTQGDLRLMEGASQYLTVTTDGDVVIGSGALATNATSGFFEIPGSAGTPTGVPTGYAGRYPITWDATGNTLYVYDGGWNAVAGGGGGITGSGTLGQATFWTGSSVVSGDNAFWWDNTGKEFGLGTTSPGARLQVESTSTNLPAAIFVGGTSVGTANANAGQINLGDISTRQASLAYDYSGVDLYIDNTFNSATADLVFRTKASATPVEVARFNGDGDLTLATAAEILSPSSGEQAFTVDGGSNTFGHTNDGQIQFGGISGDSGNITYSYSGRDLYIDNRFNSATGDIVFRTRTAGTPVETLRLAGDGVATFVNRAYLGTNPSTSTTGILNVPNDQGLTFRNAANSANIDVLKLNSSDNTEFGRTSGAIVNLDFGPGSTLTTLQVQNGLSGLVNTRFEGKVSVYDSNAFGTAPALTGAINLPNNETLSARNAANNADIDLIRLNASDYIEFDRTLSSTTNLDFGPASTLNTLKIQNGLSGLLNTEFEGKISVFDTNAFGSSPALSGAINIPNDMAITARNAADSGDINLIKLNASDNIEFMRTSGAIVDFDFGPGSTLTTLEVQNSGTSGLVNTRFEGKVSVYDSDNFGSTPALSGVINIPNNMAITSRDAAGTGDIDIIKLNASDYIEFPRTGTSVTNLDFGPGSTLNTLNIQNSGSGSLHTAFEGSILIGISSVTTNGSIRYTGTDFEGRVGGSWSSLTAATGAAIGTGAAGQATFWTGTSTVSGDSGFFWDNSSKELGIGTSSPDATLEVLDATGPQLRLTQSNGVDEADFNVDSSGDLTIDPTGGDLIVDGNIIPTAGSDDTYDLGTSSIRWRDLYLGPTSLNIDCKATECGSSREWGFSVQESIGSSRGNLRATLGASEMFTVSTSGNVGIGEAVPTSTLHVVTSDTGATADTTWDDIVIENSGTAGISIISGNASTRALVFGDTADSMEGGIAMLSDDTLILYSNNLADSLAFDTSGNITVSDGLTLGNSSSTTNGTLRYTGSDIEGRVGGAWTSLTGSGGSGAPDVTTIATPSGTSPMTWATEINDTNARHTGSGSRITVQTGETKVRLKYHGSYAAGGTFNTTLLKNGVALSPNSGGWADGDEDSALANSGVTVQSAILTVVATDYFEVTASSTPSTGWFEMEVLQ